MSLNPKRGKRELKSKHNTGAYLIRSELWVQYIMITKEISGDNIAHYVGCYSRAAYGSLEESKSPGTVADACKGPPWRKKS